MRPQSQKSRWQLGIEFASFAEGAEGAGFKAKPTALKSLANRLQTYGVKLDCKELTRLEPSERIAALRRTAESIDMGAAPLFALGWAAGRLLAMPQSVNGISPPVPAGLVNAAETFLQLAATTTPDIRAELEEVEGWCRAVISGWSTQCRSGQYQALVARTFGPIEVEPVVEAQPATFETATLDHVKTMIALRVICLLAQEEESDDVLFEGDLGKGTLVETDRSESNYAIGWDSAGVVAFGYHKYASAGHKEPPTSRLVGLPESLSPLAQRLSEGAAVFTCGFWISTTGRHLDRVGSDEDGSDLIERFASEPEAAMSKAWGPAGKSERKLAVALAERAVAGGGRIGVEEGEDLFDLEPGKSARRTRIAKQLARLNLKLRG